MGMEAWMYAAKGVKVETRSEAPVIASWIGNGRLHQWLMHENAIGSWWGFDEERGRNVFEIVIDKVIIGLLIYSKVEERRTLGITTRDWRAILKAWRGGLDILYVAEWPPG